MQAKGTEGNTGSPNGDCSWINWLLARDRPGRLGGERRAAGWFSTIRNWFEIGGVEIPSRKTRIRLEYKIQHQNPIQVRAGESVELGRAGDEDPSWLWCRAADSGEGRIVVELLQPHGPLAIVLRDYSAKELAVQPGGSSRDRCSSGSACTLIVGKES